jgi:caffeoyl-CoA O-methyltransferase
MKVIEPMSGEAYVESLYEPDTMLEQVKEDIRSRNMPEISVSDGYGRLLTLLVRMNRCYSVLEIGALGGYSGICLARGIESGGKLVSLELKQEFADVAKMNLTAAGFGGIVEYRVGEALDHLAQLKTEGAKFDLFFIDADKVNYPNYLEAALELASPGAIIVGDNILMRGRVPDPAVAKKSVQAMREFNRRIAQESRLESTILPAYDGLAIARYRG